MSILFIFPVLITFSHTCYSLTLIVWNSFYSLPLNADFSLVNVRNIQGGCTRGYCNEIEFQNTRSQVYGTANQWLQK